MNDFTDLEEIIAAVVDHGFQLHSSTGPGLLESVYEAFLSASLREAGLDIEQQVTFPATYRQTTIQNAFRIDLLVERKLIVEIKSVERLAPVFQKQVLTYLRLTGLPVGLLINFGNPTYEGAARRIIDSRHRYQGRL